MIHASINADVLVTNVGNRIKLIRPGSSLGRSITIVNPSSSATAELGLTSSQTTSVPTGTAPLPLFSTVQDLITLLEEEMGIDPTVLNLQYNPQSEQLTFHLKWSDGFSVQSVPLNLNLPLGDLGNVTTSATGTISGSIAINLGVGIGLGNTTAAEIAGQATSEFPSDGVLNEDAHFSLTLPGGQPVALTIPAATTSSDTSVVDPSNPYDPATLLGVINTAIADMPSLRGKVLATSNGEAIQFSLISGGALGLTAPSNGVLGTDLNLQVTLGPAPTTQTVVVLASTTTSNASASNPTVAFIGDINTALSANPALSGFVQANANGSAVQFILTGGLAPTLTPPSNGVLASDLNFTLQLGPNAMPVSLTVPASATMSNTALANPTNPNDPTTLLGQINAALAASPLLSGKVEAVDNLGQVQFVLAGGLVPSITVPANGVLSSDLGLAITLSTLAPPITGSGPTTETVVLPASATLGNASQAQPIAALVGQLNTVLAADPILSGDVLAEYANGVLQFVLSPTLAPPITAPSNGQLTSDLSVLVQLGPNASPVVITIPAYATTGNTAIADPTNPNAPGTLVGEINAAIASNAALSGHVEAFSDGPAIRFSLTGALAPTFVPPANGTLASDLAVQLTLGPLVTPATITVPASTTTGDTSLYNASNPNDPTTLIGQINAAIAANPVLAGNVQASLVNGVVVLGTIGRAAVSNRPLQVTSNLDAVSAAMSDPAFSALGLPGNGQLGAGSSFTLTLSGHNPITVNLPSSATANDTSIADPANPLDPTTLVGQLNLALQSALTAANLDPTLVTATAAGGRIEFVAGSTVTALQFNAAANDPLVAELGFSNGASADAVTAGSLFLTTGQLVTGTLTLGGTLSADAQLGPLNLMANGGSANISGQFSVSLQDPLNPSAPTIDLETLGTDISDLTSSGTIILPASLAPTIAPPANGVLTSDLNITIQPGTSAAPVTITILVANTSGDTSAANPSNPNDPATLLGQINAAIAANSALDGVIEAIDNNGVIQFGLIGSLAGGLTSSLTGNGSNSPVSVDLSGSASFSLQSISVNGLQLLSGGAGGLSVTLPTLLLPSTQLALGASGDGQITDTAHFNVTLPGQAPVSVTVNPSETNNGQVHSLADLATIVQNDINSALTAAGVTGSVVVTADADGIHLDLSSPSSPSTAPKVTDLVLTDLDGLDGLGDLRSLSLAQIIEDIQTVVNALAPSQANQGSSAFAFLDQPIPILNVSAAQIVNYAGTFAQDLQQFQQNPDATLDQLQSELEQALGVNIPLTITFDNHILKIEIDWRTNVSEETPLNLNLQELAAA